MNNSSIIQKHLDREQCLVEMIALVERFLDSSTLLLEDIISVVGDLKDDLLRLHILKNLDKGWMHEKIRASGESGTFS